LRSEYNVPPGQSVEVVVVPAEATLGPVARQLFEHEAALIGRLTRSNVRVESTAPGGASATAIIVGGTQVVLPLAGLIDVAKECKRLEGELANLDKQLGALRGRLANENFVARAKPEVVQMERAKELEWGARRDQLAAKVQALCGA
jgi:valyl-tRNA synthetase